MQSNSDPIRRVVVLIYGKNALVPSFASAISARRHITRADTGVKILVVGADPDWLASLVASVEAEGIGIEAATVPEIKRLR